MTASSNWDVDMAAVRRDVFAIKDTIGTVNVRA